jgi:hypothetical protein
MRRLLTACFLAILAAGCATGPTATHPEQRHHVFDTGMRTADGHVIFFVGGWQHPHISEFFIPGEKRTVPTSSVTMEHATHVRWSEGGELPPREFVYVSKLGQFYEPPEKGGTRVLIEPLQKPDDLLMQYLDMKESNNVSEAIDAGAPKPQH